MRPRYKRFAVKRKRAPSVASLIKHRKNAARSASYLEALITTCTQAGLPKPCPEYSFFSARKWRFDAAWPEAKVACEIEGGIWSKGRHTSPRGFEADMHKYNTAASIGWLVIRVSPEMVNAGAAADYIRRAYELRSAASGSEETR